jgi:thiamine transport system permease protein
VSSGAGSVSAASRPRWLREAGEALLLWGAPLLFLAGFYFYPLGSILALSFSRLAPGPAAWEPLLQALLSPAMRQVIGFTFWQALLSTLITLLVGLPGAYLLARYDFPGKSLFRALTGVPFIMPTLVVAAAFNSLLGPRGWANLALMDWLNLEAPPLQFTNTLGAILLAHVFYNTTIVLRVVGDFWSRLDPRLMAAGRSLGAGPGRVLWHITLPLLAPAIAAAALLVFLFDFTSFGVILVLGGPRYATLEVEIYYQITGLFNLPLAAILALVQLACTLALTAVYTRLSLRLSRPVTLRPQSYTLSRLSSWRSRLAALLVIGGLTVLLVLPLVSLAARSVTRLEPERGRSQLSGPPVTLDFYRALAEQERQSLFAVSPLTAIGISLGYASLTVILALALGTPAAWALARREPGAAAWRERLNRLLDPLLMLPVGTSAVTLGLGFIVALGRPPLDLRASPLLIPLAHTLVAFPSWCAA